LRLRLRRAVGEVISLSLTSLLVLAADDIELSAQQAAMG
jgi:hypothetical protein